ncbi:MAG: hypothetical protein HC837_02650 [Chloroflexaceae bacterium]|nr:hypothetical protein [Chloroflexaceae bacterium]
MDESRPAQPARAADRTPAAPRPRIRPEDIELSPEEKKRAASVDTTALNQAKQRPRVRPEDIELSPEEKRRAAGSRYSSSTADPKASSKPSFLGGRGPIVLVVILCILLAVIAFLLFTGRASAFLSSVQPVTVTVAPPVLPTEEQELNGIVIPMVQVGQPTDATAIQASPMSAMVAFTVTGQAANETMVPATYARGAVTMYNRNEQAISLPQGTEFIGYNPQGREVRFTNDIPVTIPPVTTVRQGPQIIITFGEAYIEITARTPGSDSNIEADSITQLVIPGQQPLTVNTGALLLEHGPITGGSEQPIRVVRDIDVQQVLGEVLTGLNNRARQELETELTRQGNGLALEVTTIIPTANDLKAGHGYEQSIIPPIGAAVEPSDPTFSVAAHGHFSALAVPQDQSLQEQLQVAVPNYLASVNQLPDGMVAAINHWQWDGTRITVDGMLLPTGETAGLNAQTRAAIRDALKGKNRDEAEVALKEFQLRGVISSYDLPQNLDTIPTWDFLLDLKVVSPDNPS